MPKDLLTDTTVGKGHTTYRRHYRPIIGLLCYITEIPMDSTFTSAGKSVSKAKFLKAFIL